MDSRIRIYKKTYGNGSGAFPTVLKKKIKQHLVEQLEHPACRSELVTLVVLIPLCSVVHALVAE
jgi:hypothetical protein